MLESDFTAVPAGEVTKRLGENFTAALSRPTPGRWEGPVESGFGAHVVLLVERTSSRVPELGDVRQGVRREWDDARRVEAKEKVYEEMLARYRTLDPCAKSPGPSGDRWCLAAAYGGVGLVPPL